MVLFKRTRYNNKQFIHDIGSEEGKYLNTLTKVQVNKDNGTISLNTGLIVTGKQVSFSHVIGRATA